ncbi:methyl-accepting chemotaxis protein [Derxia lacustris]|uniref:methyl-accepting chemotaxis protein n=1 Tax=Derxia lacustris TaxID=764842 RepID=UPI000A1767B4|nr:methyl-accepting chemotaxis protein [Derxia lacustris]
MNLSRITVRRQLALGFGSLAAACLTIAIIGMLALSAANDQFFTYINGIGERGQLVSQLGHATKDRAIAVRNALLATDSASRERHAAAAQAADERVTQLLARYNRLVAEATDMSDRARKIAQQVNEVELRYQPVATSVMQLALRGEREQAVARMNDECIPLLDQLNTVLDDYTDIVATVQRERGGVALAALHSKRLWLGGIALVALALAGTLGWLVTRSILGSLGGEPALLGDIVGRVAGGDLRRIAEADGAPAGSVMASLGAMQANLVGLIARVGGSAENIATASVQIATGNQDLSRRTEQQASALQQTTAQMQQMTENVRTNAASAQQVSQLASEASRVADEGGRVVERVVTTMDEISESSRRIGDIIGVIDGIAFQTNILALNAAVEAARAGEQGRGFAVVAAEVRSLASRSAEAAKEIKLLIDTSSQRVGTGSSLAGEAGATMSRIVTQVARMSGLIGEIAAATGEQASGIAQVNQAVGSLDASTQQNAALVEQSAAAADSLRLQARSMTQLVGNFTLEG